MSTSSTVLIHPTKAIPVSDMFMSRDKVNETITKIKPGAYTWLEYLCNTGPIISVSIPSISREPFDAIPYVSKKGLVRFKVDYNKLRTTRLENLILKSTTEEQLNTCKRIYELMPPRERKVLGNYAYDKLYTGKTDKHEKRKMERTHDEKYPWCIYAKNGSILLQCFSTYAWDIVNKEPRYPVNQFYIYDIIGCSYYKIELNEDEIRTLGAAMPPIHISNPTSTFTVNYNNIIKIN